MFDTSHIVLFEQFQLMLSAGDRVMLLLFEPVQLTLNTTDRSVVSV